MLRGRLYERFVVQGHIYVQNGFQIAQPKIQIVQSVWEHKTLNKKENKRKEKKNKTKQNKTKTKTKTNLPKPIARETPWSHNNYRLLANNASISFLLFISFKMKS